MLEFAKTQKEMIAIVADAVDRFQRSFKESVLIDELIKKEKVELHFHRERMVIGKGGQKIKDIGSAARKEIETFLDSKVFLGLQVNVLKDWTKVMQLAGC